MRRVAIVLVGWLVAGLVQAKAPDAARPLLEGSMLVRGTVSVDATGAVTAYSLDSRSKLPEPVRTLLDGTLPSYRFEPVQRDGQPVAVNAEMSLRVLANEIDRQHIAVTLSSAYFTEKKDEAGTDRIVIDHREPMSYPKEAEHAGVNGTVYLALRIDRSGHVVQADAQQVNLRFWQNDVG